jgi:hypothetical protein
LPNLIETLVHSSAKQSGNAVIVDEDQSMATYNAALWLAERFDGVVMLTSRETFAMLEALVHRQGIFNRLHRRGITLLAFSRPDLDEDELAQGMVGYRHVITDAHAHIDDVAVLSYAAHRVPRLELLGDLEGAGITPRIIGDAFAPRGLLQATAEGFELAMSL